MLRDDFSSEENRANLRQIRLNLDMLLKAKFWLEMISATVKKKDQTKAKLAVGAYRCLGMISRLKKIEQT